MGKVGSHHKKKREIARIRFSCHAVSFFCDCRNSTVNVAKRNLLRKKSCALKIFRCYMCLQLLKITLLFAERLIDDVNETVSEKNAIGTEEIRELINQEWRKRMFIFSLFLGFLNRVSTGREFKQNERLIVCFW